MKDHVPVEYNSSWLLRIISLMYPCILTVIAAISYSPVVGSDQAHPTVSEVLTFQSVTFNNFRQLLAQDPLPEAIRVRAHLSFPEEVKNRYPALVIVQTISGYNQTNEGEIAAEFREAGFATLTYDSFAARRTSGLAQSRLGPGLWATGVADAYKALALLESHPKIDPERIAIVGFSYGGEVAHLTAFEFLRAARRNGHGRFSAHVAFYPAGVFGAIPGPAAYTGPPILMLLGEKDDNLPVAKLENYLAFARQAGHAPPIETVTYPGAYHAWTVPTLTTLRLYPEYRTTKMCPLILLGSSKPTFLSDDQSRPFDTRVLSTCLKEGLGYSMLYDAKIRKRSVEDTIAFLKRTLQ